MISESLMTLVNLQRINIVEAVAAGIGASHKVTALRRLKLLSAVPFWLRQNFGSFGIPCFM